VNSILSDGIALRIPIKAKRLALGKKRKEKIKPTS
jgi:hypothetical protein